MRKSKQDLLQAQEAQRRAARAQILKEFYEAPDQARFGQDVIAPVIDYSESRLERWRWEGGGPPFVRIGGTNTTDSRGRTQVFGGRVFYVKRDVVGWLDAQRPVNSTSEYDVQAAA